MLLDFSGSFRPEYSLGYNQEPSVELKPETAAVQVLKETRQPSRVYLDDDSSWTQRTPEEEREILRILDAQLLLPVALKDRLLGIISLGPKLSEEPYSADDLRLLNAVASQTGLALENASLTESIKREVAQRERINRELEIAREVQQRLVSAASSPWWKAWISQRIAARSKGSAATTTISYNSRTEPALASRSATFLGRESAPL